MYLKNSDGEKSMTATFSIVAFVVVMVKILISGAGIQLGSFTYDFGTVDSLTVAAIMGPILGTYAFRKYTETRYGTPYESYEVGQTYEVDDVGSSARDGRE